MFPRSDGCLPEVPLARVCALRWHGYDAGSPPSAKWASGCPARLRTHNGGEEKTHFETRKSGPPPGLPALRPPDIVPYSYLQYHRGRMDWLILLLSVVVVEVLLSGGAIRLFSLMAGGLPSRVVVPPRRGLKFWLLGFGSLALPAGLYILLFGPRATTGGTVLAVILGLGVLLVVDVFRGIENSMRLLTEQATAPPLCQAFIIKLGWGKPFWNDVLKLLPHELGYLEAQGRVGEQFLCVTIERWRSHTTIEVHEDKHGASPQTESIRDYGSRQWQRMEGWFDSQAGSIWSLQLDGSQRVPGDWPTLEVRLLLPSLPLRHTEVGRIQLCVKGGRFGRISDWSWEPRPENIFLDIPLDKSDSHEDSERGFHWSLSVHDLERVGYDLLSDTSSAESAHFAPRPNAFINPLRLFGHYTGRLLRRARPTSVVKKTKQTYNHDLINIK